MKRLRGSGTHNSPMNRDRTPRRSDAFHGGSGAPKGVVHAPRSQIYGTHGGTDLPRTLKKRK
jgi:hypothetical protein